MADPAPPETPSGRSNGSNGDPPSPPGGRPAAGPHEPPNGQSANPPDPEPRRTSEPVTLWAPSWPRWVRRFLGVAAILIPTLFFASWSYAEPARDFCGGCHTVESAAASSAASVHAEVPCLSCHHRPGFIGSITYYPTLLREAIHETTGIPVARNVLEPRPCASCHEEVAESEGHRDLTTDCLTCHREVAHPVAAEVSDEPHPSEYFRLHGRDAVSSPAACSECHKADFCQVCHVQAPYPHPEAWNSDHGTVVVDRGNTSCDSCHGRSFCIGCHGTDIPHPEDWFSQHNEGGYVTLEACTTCHAETECSTCHAQHLVHREQSLYDLETTP